MGEVNLLCEFTTMHKDPQDEHTRILHSEMSQELLTNTGQDLEHEKSAVAPVPEQEIIDVNKIPKKRLQANPNNWHPKLKEKLEGPLKTTGNPLFTKIMNFCKKMRTAFPQKVPQCVS